MSNHQVARCVAQNFRDSRGIAAAFYDEPEARAMAGQERPKVIGLCVDAALLDADGTTLDDIREMTEAMLRAQDFRMESVALWLDDLFTDAAKIAREARA